MNHAIKIPRAESKTVEFKTAFNQDAIVALVAFANADGGDVCMDDRMEFTNPGGLPHGLTVDDLLSDAYVTSPRNPQLASLFKAVGLTERYGSGIKRIEDACGKHGGVRVEFENNETWFKVVLSKVHSGESAISVEGSKKTPQKSSQKILEAICGNPEVTTQELADMLGISRRAVARHVAAFQASGALHRIGPDKGGHWEVIGK